MADYIDDDNLWKEDLFATLGVANTANEGEIKKAYLKLAKKYHPDRFIEDNAEKLEAQRLFAKITVAYDTLSDPQKKNHYLELRRLLANHLPEGQTPPPPKEAPPQQSAAPQNATAAAAPKAAAPASAPPKKEPPKQEVKVADKVKEEQANSFFSQGMEYYKRKQFDRAIDLFKQAINIKGDIAQFHSQLGLAYLEKNWVSMAQAEFKLALKFDPRDKVAKTNYKEEPKKKKEPEKKGGLFGGLFSFGKKK